MTAMRQNVAVGGFPLTRVEPSWVEGGPHGPTMSEEDCRVESLQREVVELREAVRTRELIGWVCGLLAHRYELSQEQVWQLLVQMSQNTNTKLREVARVISAAHGGTLTVADQQLAMRLNGQLDGILASLADDRTGGPTRVER